MTALKSVGELTYVNNVRIGIKKVMETVFFVIMSSPVSEVITEPCALDITTCNALGNICRSFIVLEM